ncbi:SKP1 component POZ domain-containing protein [Plasmodiophora brassicae]|uniref:SKP1 component POZ domain-containing protein n=1 Tax=Plasmodiophora brassicae TaxID=37360 RepID=A0A0G4J2C3_PLABS|nr:hypothetical protein PBRA_008579 [Plasmodiophora brassicae]SPQ99474.1 unnamed protein product [Plasmodiophora brassicae]
MSIGNRMRVSRAVVLAAVLAGLIDAVTITVRSSDGAEFTVDEIPAAAHSTLLKHLLEDVADNDGLLVRLPNVARRDLGQIVKFMQTIAHDDVQSAVQWVRDRTIKQSTVRFGFRLVRKERLCQASLQRILDPARYLDMNLLLVAVLLSMRTWADFASIREQMPPDILRFVVDRSRGMSQLRRAGNTRTRSAIVKGVRKLLVLGEDADLFRQREAHATLVNKGVWARITGNVPVNVLHWAAAHGLCVVVDMLLQIPDINVNSRVAPYRRTPLHVAALYGNDDVVRVLLKHGAKVNALDSTGGTPLHNAAKLGRYRVVKALAEAPGIQIHAFDERRNTPFALALQSGHHGTALLLAKLSEPPRCLPVRRMRGLLPRTGQGA